MQEDILRFYTEENRVKLQINIPTILSVKMTEWRSLSD